MKLTYHGLGIFILHSFIIASTGLPCSGIYIVILVLLIFLHFIRSECGQGQGNSGCGTKRTFQAECGEIIVEEHEESACDWQINVGNSQMINLTFAEFKLQDGGQY